MLLPEMGTAYQEIAVLDLRDGRTALRASNLVYLYGGHAAAFTRSRISYASFRRIGSGSTVRFDFAWSPAWVLGSRPYQRR